MHLCQGFFPILILLFLTSILATDSSPTRWRRSKELRDSGDVTDEVIDVVEAEKLSRATTDKKVKKVFDEKQRKARNKVQEVSDSILDKHIALTDLLMDDSFFDDDDEDALTPVLSVEKEKVEMEEEEETEGILLTRSLLPNGHVKIPEATGPTIHDVKKQKVKKQNVREQKVEQVQRAQDQSDRLQSDPETAAKRSSTTEEPRTTVQPTSEATQPDTTTSVPTPETTTEVVGTTVSHTEATTEVVRTTVSPPEATSETSSTESSAGIGKPDSTITVSTTLSSKLTTNMSSTLMAMKPASVTTEPTKVVKSTTPRMEDLTIDEEEANENIDLESTNEVDDQHCHPKDVSCQSKSKGDNSFMARSDISAAQEECLNEEDGCNQVGNVDRVMEITVDPESVEATLAEQPDADGKEDVLQVKSQSIFSLFKSFWSWF